MKAVFVGDCATGKTCLLYTLANKEYPVDLSFSGSSYSYTTPTNPPHNITLVDTVGQEDSSRLRITSYEEADAFVLCFSVISPFSFDNIRTKVWSFISTYHEDSHIF